MALPLYDLTAAQRTVLAALARTNGQRHTVSTLAVAVKKSPPSVNATTLELAKRGLITRQSPEGNKGHQLQLTSGGWDAIGETAAPAPFAIACPWCRAQAGARCVNRRGYAIADRFHAARIQEATHA